MSGLVLVTGGTGKTGRRLAERLRAAGVSSRVASRNAPRAPGSHPFDWAEPDSWAAALDGVSAAYLVPPPAGGDASATMIAFVEAAIRQGARRFVLLSASPLPAGGPAAGQVHLWLRENAAHWAAEWAVLRPSWFMQNFSEGQHRATILSEGAIYSATEDGRTPFIDADDIAAAAFAALTSPAPPNADFILTGPHAVTYDTVAATIGAAIGRPVVHRRIGAATLAERHRAAGLPPATAQMLAIMDTMIAAGAEDRVTDTVEALTGRAPSGFEAFVEKNAAAWRRQGPDADGGSPRSSSSKSPPGS